MMLRRAPCLTAIALLAGLAPALAGGIGAVSQVPQISGLQGRVAIPGSVNTPGTLSSLGGVGMNVSNSDGVSVQTNIDASRNVQGNSNVTINETINGTQVGYGMGGDFLSDANAQGQAALAQRQAYIQQLQNEVELMVQVWPGN